MSKYERSCSKQRRWAEFRFSVIGQLLSSPPGKGELALRLKELASRTYLNPINGEAETWTFSTIERWYYLAKNSPNPVDQLMKLKRNDHGDRAFTDTGLCKRLRDQYRQHPSWSKQLHYDNLKAMLRDTPDLGPLPSYSTVRRWMSENAMPKAKPRQREKRLHEGEARADFSAKETRSFEALNPGSLWHLDFHKANRRVVNFKGKWFVPILLAIIDDHSRLLCHLQWYEEETTEVLVHGFRQALQKRGLPRELLNDNGSAMTSHEFTTGLRKLSITPNTTLPYCPEQNGKQERFFGTLEGRLMAQLENKKDLNLQELNDATIAWAEMEYNKNIHSETSASPSERFFSNKSVHRECPSSSVLDLAFCRQEKRKPRRFDATVSVLGVRFEIPWQHRHFQQVIIRYRTWDLSFAWLMDQDGETEISKILPIDKARNASGIRKPSEENTPESSESKNEVSPLISKMLADYSATGMPYPYSHKEKG